MRRIVLLLGITALAAISLAQCTVESTGGGKSMECLDVPQSWIDLILVEGGLVPLDNLNIAAIKVDGKIEAKLPGNSDWKPYFRNSTYPHMVGATVDGVDGVAAWLTTISEGTTFPVNAAAAQMSHFGTDQPDNFRMSPTDTSDVAQCLSQGDRGSGESNQSPTAGSGLNDPAGPTSAIEGAISRNATATATIPDDSSGRAVVHVLGTPGLKFAGSIGDGTSSRPVEGTAPASFGLTSTTGIFVAVIQKNTASGVMSVLVECGDTSPTQSTAAAYGVVTVSCSE